LIASNGKHDPYSFLLERKVFGGTIRTPRRSFWTRGHFAVETHLDEIAFAIRRFLASGISLT
jgi:hypothetical protein